MKLKVKNENLKKLQDIFKVVSNEIPSVLLKIDKEGIFLKETTPSEILMVGCNINSSLFDKYEVPKGKEIMIDVETFYDRMKKVRDDETLTIEEEENKLKLKAEGDNIEREFFTPILDRKTETKEDPDLDIKNKVIIEPDLLRSSFRDISSLSDNIVVEITENRLNLKGGESQVSIGKEKLEKFDTKEKNKSSKFSTDYFKNLVTMKRGPVELRMGQDVPIIEKIDEEDFKIKIIIAPRVDRR